MGFTEPCFDDSDEAIAQAAVAADWDFDAVRARAGSASGSPKGVARFADGGFDTPSGKVEFYSTAAQVAGPRSACPITSRRRKIHAARSRSRYPLAMISPPARNFLNSSFVNVTEPACRRRRAVARHSSRRCCRARHHRGSYVRVFNDRGSLELRARVSDRARRGVVVALSVWWKKLARDGKNANELTSSDTLTDMGRAPIFYDCLVQVEAL